MKTSVPSHKGHRQVLQETIEGNYLEHLAAPLDQVVPERLWARDFKVDMESMAMGNQGCGIPSVADPGVLVFTDGSKKTDDYTGVGIVFTRNNECMKDQAGAPLIFTFRLRDVNSVYQSETWAIKKAVQMITERVGNPEDSDEDNPSWIKRGESLTIYSDSQATLKALNKVQIKSRLVMETIDALNKLTNKLNTQVTLKWVRGHSGFKGNVAADTAAAKARDLVGADPDSPDPPKSILYTEVDAAATQMWRNLWEDTLGHRQTRYWFPDGPDPQFAFDIIRLPKLICSQVVAFITGHCHLNRHQALIDDAETEQIRKHTGNVDSNGEAIIPPADPTCTMCKFDPSQKNKEETPLHLMTECVGLWRLRQDIFGKHNPTPPFRFPVHQIVAFLKEAKIPTFPMQPYLEELYPTALTGTPDQQPQPQIQSQSQQQPQVQARPRPRPNPHPTPGPGLDLNLNQDLNPSADQNTPPNHQSQMSPSTEVTGGTTPDRVSTQSSQLRQPPPSHHPEGDKWYHTYLYLSNPLLKPHKEKELLRQPHMRPLRY